MLNTSLSLILFFFNVLLTLAANCGNGIGSCKAGYCCSKYGYCGKSELYCGSGCQIKYGLCNSSASMVTTKKTTTKKVTTTMKTTKKTTKTSTSAVKPTVAISTNGHCGNEYGRCPGSKCCSKYGYCGTSDLYCGTGCQSEFGKCNGQSVVITTTKATSKKTTTSTKKITTTKKTTIKTTTTTKKTTTKKTTTTTKKTTTTTVAVKPTVAVSTDGQCGEGHGMCPEGGCCSQYGYCGSSDAHCGTGCQSEFGSCGIVENEIKYIKECKKSNQWALTFDDGSYEYDNALLDLLKKKGVKATFFVNGYNYGKSIEERASFIKRMYNEGHVVASHTYAHINLSEKTNQEIIDDMTKLDNAIYKIIKKRPAIMRPPRGDGNGSRRIADVLTGLGINSAIMWNVDTMDWSNKGDIDYALNEFKKELGHSVISLNHNAYSGITKDKLVNLAEAEIDYMIEHGYEPVTIDECIGLPAYKN